MVSQRSSHRIGELREQVVLRGDDGVIAVTNHLLVEGRVATAQGARAAGRLDSPGNFEDSPLPADGMELVHIHDNLVAQLRRRVPRERKHVARVEAASKVRREHRADVVLERVGPVSRTNTTADNKATRIVMFDFMIC